MIDQTNNYCQCSAGVCSTVIVPKLNKYGAAGFSYTVTDKDGVSAIKTVSLNVTAMSTATSHLKPVVQSSYAGLFTESNTSTASAYAVPLSGASDIAGTAAASMRYYFSGTKNGSNQGLSDSGLGKITNCLDLVGSSGLTDLTCTFTPNSGDTFDVSAPAIASVLIGSDLTYTAKSAGLAGNSITVQYFDLTTDNTSADSYVTTVEKYGLVGLSESFIRVSGNAIKVFINPGVTTSLDIQTMINAHPQASRMVSVAGATPSPFEFPVPSVATAAAVNLAGGVDGFDTFKYYANNGQTNSSNTATATLRITSVNDLPMVPKTYNSLFAQTISLLEQESKASTLGFTDVDDTTNFTVEIKVDATTPTCDTSSANAALTNFFDNLLVASTNFTITPPGLGDAVCVSGVCTVPITVQALQDFSGNACMYYKVTDIAAAQSWVQPVALVVTNINDTPLLSSATLPVWPSTIVTALGTDVINEDLAAGFDSYTDIYAGPSGGVWEASQLLTVTAVSSNTTLIPNTACTNYTPVVVSPIGSVIPSAVGLKRFDTVTNRCYISTGTSLVSDWKLFPSLTVYPACAYNYFGQGSPVGVVSPAAAGNRYLDTTNNKCFKSASTSASSWAQDNTLTNYKISYAPASDKSGTANITVNVKDNGGTANAAVDNVSGIIALTVNSIPDSPYFLESISSVMTNEGGAVQSDGFKVDEDEASTTDEDADGVFISQITSDNSNVLPVTAVGVFYDLNDNGVEDSGELRTGVAGTPTSAGPYAQFETVAGTDAKLHKFYLKLDPVDGVSGNANITLTISDGTVASTVSKSFSFIVHPIAALHGGWSNISSVGIKTDKNNSPVSAADIKCNYNKLTDTKKCAAGTAACTGSTSPNSTVVPDDVGVIYYDSSAQRCYRSTGLTAFTWVEMNTSCPITRSAGYCSNNNCIVSALGTPDFVGQYKFRTTDSTCHVSTTAGSWEAYVPANVTLAWKPFIMVGSGADSGVQISGWNVYRREAGADYNFKGGHLKNTASTADYTVADPTIRTFTDTTAIAGKVYYYVVRPVDSIRKFPTYTPETFSETRVIASPANYSFVHRWIVNQEMCNGMSITNTTTPYHVDQTQNFRCEYNGPGSVLVSGVRYYDYGRDLLVDTQESGCAYASAPACSANGCVGIGAPSSTSGVVANDKYYDRSSGACYVYDGSWKLTENGTLALSANIVNTSNTALNAPLTNISKARAISYCAARTKPSVTGFTISVATPILPNKKDYMAYSSQKLVLTDPEVTELEQGLSLNIQSRCNASSASGLETAYTDSSIPSTSFIYSLPGTASSGIKSLYTGSIPWASSKGTEACVSRFGVQDLYGNVAEWVNDGITCNAVTKVCTVSTAADNSFTATDFGVSAYAFDNSIGPYGEGGDGVVNGTDDYWLTQWTYSNELFGAEQFNYPLGMPISSNIDPTTYSAFIDWVLDIGPSNGITINKLHEDGMIFNGSAAAKSFALGGSYLSGNMAGRFSTEFVPNTVVNRPDVGFRCIVPINTAEAAGGGDYPDDAFYTYPN